MNLIFTFAFINGKIINMIGEVIFILCKGSELMKENTCCFTGHRHIPPKEKPEITLALKTVITNLYEKGVRRFEAGGALGFDTLAAKAVLNLRRKLPGMELILILPCQTQTRGWTPEDTAEYERIKAQANLVVYTSTAYSRGCMYKRNRRLVDDSSICVCYLTQDKGGTAYTVKYAESKKLSIINLANIVGNTE